MRATVSGAALLAAAQLAARVAGKSGTSIGNVLIEAVDGDIELSLTSTDYERSARSTVDADIDTPGAAGVDASKLAAICGVLGVGPVTLATDGGNLAITATGARFSLPLYGENVPAPGPDAFDLGDAVEVMPGAQLAALLSTAAAFAGHDDTRPALVAVCIRDGQVLATDGRFAMLGDLGELKIADLLLPLASVEILAGEIGAQRVDDVGLAVVGRNVAFAVGRARFVTRHSDLKFPRIEDIYDQVRSGGNVGQLDAKALLHGLKVAAVVGADEKRIQLISDHTGLRIESFSAIAAGTRAAVDCGQSLFAAPVRIWLSATLLRTVLSMCGPASTIRIHGEQRPVLVESASYRFILMPMRENP